MKLLIRLLVLTLVLWVAPGLSAKEVVKIGVILPLTGNNAQLGEPIRELIQYKIKHFPKDSRFDYKVFFEDDQATPRLSLLAAHRLVDLEGVDVLLTYLASPGGAVAPFATQSKTPHLMWNFNTSVADGVYNFDHVASIDKCVETWTSYADASKDKKVAFLVLRSAGGESLVKKLEARRAVSGLEWTAVERFNPGDRDFRVTLAKIRETRPQTLFVFAIEPELQIILRQMHEIGWKIPLTTISIFDIAIDNPALEGAWYVGVDSPTLEWGKWYSRTLGKAPSYGIATYSDYIDLIYRACEEAPQKPVKESLAACLRKIKDFKGASGMLTCNDKGVLETAPVLLRIKNAVPTPIKQF